MIAIIDRPRDRMAEAFLTRDEERALIVIAQQNVGIGPTVELAAAVDARNTLIERNSRFIWGETIKFARRLYRSKNRAPEFIGVATLAYINAIEKIDLSRGIRLNSYAGRAIQNTLSNDYNRTRFLVRVPLPAQHGEGSEDVQRHATAAKLPAVSIHTRVDHGEGDTVGDIILGREAKPDQCDGLPPLADVLAIMETMPERWVIVLQRRMDGASFSTIAVELEVSKQRAQEIEGQAFAYIRRQLGWPNPASPVQAASQPSAVSLVRQAS